MKIFNFSVNNALTFVITCYALHNYYEVWKILEPDHVNDVTKKDNLAGFSVGRLPTLQDGKQAKQVRELMKRVLFEQWLIDRP